MSEILSIQIASGDYQWYVFVAIFVFGLMIGSFLNVCIYRIPKSVSVVKPRSMCPSCNSKIAFYDNIPILSFVILKGKCRHCNVKISFVYPIVEILTGCMFVVFFLLNGVSLSGLMNIMFVCMLIVISFIDISHRIIPDVISLPGIVIGLIFSAINPETKFMHHLFAAVVGGGFLWAVAEIYLRVTKREGMGGGDIKFISMIGAFLGFPGVFFTIFASSLMGSLVGLMFVIFKKNKLTMAIPFGPFLAIGSFCYIIVGVPLIHYYLNNILS